MERKRLSSRLSRQRVTYCSVYAQCDDFAVHLLNIFFRDMAVIQPSSIELVEDVFCFKDG